MEFEVLGSRVYEFTHARSDSFVILDIVCIVGHSWSGNDADLTERAGGRGPMCLLAAEGICIGAQTPSQTLL